MGYSYFYNQAVSTIIANRITNTLALMLIAVIFSYSFGVYLGAHMGWIRGTKLERVEMIIVLIARSMPVFWTGMVILYIFSFELGWFPVGGIRGATANPSGPIDRFFSMDFLHHVALPVITLTLYYTGLPLLLMRNNMLEIVTEDYVETARAKGLPTRRVIFRHAARNAILPVVTAFAIAIGFSVGGQVLIETVFSWPGLGQEMVEASLQSDYPLAQGTFLMLASIVIIMNFLADIMYTYLDPRVRLGGGVNEH
jgi:peptide/nickel transport system permease protein